MSKIECQQRQEISDLKSDLRNALEEKRLLEKGELDTIIPTDEQRLMHENLKLDIENQKLRDTIEQNKTEMENMKNVQQQLVQENLPASSQQIVEAVNSVHSDTEVHELNQHIRELEGRMRTLNQDNELLRAQVDESDYWIYERGPIQQELLELRDNSVSQTREINRLTRENANISEDLRTAESMLNLRARRHEPHEIGHPPMNA